LSWRGRPQLLEISLEQINPVYGPAVCIAREAGMTERTSRNSIDNLYVSPEGYLTIVEAKLWSNQELRRKVLAQIIEYSANLSKRKLSDVEQMFRKYLRDFHPDRAETSLYKWVCEKAGQQIDEEEFNSNVSGCMARGEFLLLIVADRISDSTEDLIEYVRSTPGLGYSLNLIELCCYRIAEKDYPLLIVPRVVVRTAEVERAIVRVEISRGALVDVDIVAPQIGATTTSDRHAEPSDVKRDSPLVDAFFESDQVVSFLDQLSRGGVQTQPRGSSIQVLYSSKGATEDMRIWIQRDGRLFVHRGLAEQLKSSGQSPDLAKHLWSRLHSIDDRFPDAQAFASKQYSGVPMNRLIESGKLKEVASALVEFARKVAESP
jgi:hypothetical protein